MDSGQVNLSAVRSAVAALDTVYPKSDSPPSAAYIDRRVNRKLTILLAGIFMGVLGIIVVGEWMGMFEILNARIPPLVFDRAGAIAGAGAVSGFFIMSSAPR